MTKRLARVRSALIVPALFSLMAGSAALRAEAQSGGKVIARWLFDEGSGSVAADTTPGADSGAPGEGATAAGAASKMNGRIVKAAWAEGRSSRALAFEDYSLKNYLKPDVREATKVVVAHDDRLNPSGPFTLRAVIYPTKDPIYFGGIFEKGRGYGASYRLLLLRGLRVRAALGSGHTTVTSTRPLALNAWHVLEMKFDGGSLSLTVDGADEGRTAGAKLPLSSKDDAAIGDRFSGRIDEVTLTAP